MNKTIKRSGFPQLLSLLILFFLVQRVRADAPATQPADAGTPQAFLAAMTNDRLAAMSESEAVGVIDFNPDSDKDKSDAKLLATSNVVQAKLEIAVRKKWGKKAETDVAHACGDNVTDDAPGAQWTITGDHARADFEDKDLSPLLLVKKGDNWKVDMVGYRQMTGQKFEPSLHQGTQSIRWLMRQLKNAANADDFLKQVNKEMAKV